MPNESNKKSVIWINLSLKVENLLTNNNFLAFLFLVSIKMIIFASDFARIAQVSLNY